MLLYLEDDVILMSLHNVCHQMKRTEGKAQQLAVLLTAAVIGQKHQPSSRFAKKGGINRKGICPVLMFPCQNAIISLSAPSLHTGMLSEVSSVPVVSLDQSKRRRFDFYHEGRGVSLEQRSGWSLCGAGRCQHHGCIYVTTVLTSSLRTHQKPVKNLIIHAVMLH